MAITLTIHNHDSTDAVRVVEIETLSDDPEDSIAERSFVVAPGGSLTTHVHDHVSLIVEKAD